MGNIKRDNRGRFVKGQSANPKNQFTSTNQPPNSGRKPSRFKQMLEGLSSIGETLSYEDYKRITETLLTLNASELQRVAGDKNTPIAVILIANAISGDLNNQRMDNLEKLLDRLFGKTASNVDVTTKGEKVSTSIQIEVIDGQDKDK